MSTALLVALGSHLYRNAVRLHLMPTAFLSINYVIIYTPGRIAQSVGHLARNSGVLGSIPGLATYFRFSGRVAQSVGHLTRKSGVLGSIPGLATYFRFSCRLLGVVGWCEGAG